MTNEYNKNINPENHNLNIDDLITFEIDPVLEEQSADISERIDSITQENDDDDETHYDVVNSSPLPREIAKAILEREGMENLKDIPHFGSATIENFIIKKIREDIISPKEIANSFFEEGANQELTDFVKKIDEAEEKIDWEKIFTLEERDQLKNFLTEKMKEMGLNEEQIGKIKNMGININKGIGSSSLNKKAIVIKGKQIIRKAFDYISVYGDKIPFEELLKIITISTVGHEFGHAIDEGSGYSSNMIPSDESWVFHKDDDGEEAKNERFAEFWGQAVLNENKDNAQIIKKSWMINLAKVQEFWEAMSEYNDNPNHQEKADKAGIFRAISDYLEQKNPKLSPFFEARLQLYGGNAVENYASPYDEETVKKAIKDRIEERN